MNSELNYLFKLIGIQSFIDKLQMFHLSQFFPFSLPMDRERSPTHLLHFLAKFQNQNSSLHYPMTYETSLLSHHILLLAIYCLFMEYYTHVNNPINCYYFKNETQRLFIISSFSYFILICCFLKTKRCLLLLLLLTLLLLLLLLLLLPTCLSMLHMDGSLTASSLSVWTSQCSIQSHVFLLLTFSSLVTDAVKFVRILMADHPSTHKQFNDGRVEEHIFCELDSTLKSKICVIILISRLGTSFLFLYQQRGRALLWLSHKRTCL